MKKRSMSLLLAALMVVSSVFTGYSVNTEAAAVYVADEDLSDNQTVAPEAD